MPCQTQNLQITAKIIWHGIYTVLGNVYFMEKIKIKITLDEYNTTCGDGCCTNYGTVTYIDGVEMPCHNQDAPTIITQILEHLGYDVDMEFLYNGEAV